jgi:hypothetical protein
VFIVIPELAQQSLNAVGTSLSRTYQAKGHFGIDLAGVYRQ